MEEYFSTRRWVDHGTHNRQTMMKALQLLHSDGTLRGSANGAHKSAFAPRPRRLQLAKTRLRSSRWQRLGSVLGPGVCSDDDVQISNPDQVCILMVDNRPMMRSPWKAVEVGLWNDLTTYINMAYALSHNYTFLRAQYSPELMQGRSYLWSKVLVLWRVASSRLDCKYLAFIDTDAHFVDFSPLEPVLHHAGLMRPEGPLFMFPREPEGINPFKDFLGNDLSNTRMSTGFIAVRNTKQSRAMLHEWWLTPLLQADMSRYLYQWSHEQRVWDKAIRDRYPGTWTELPENMTARPLFNTPEGAFVRHQWWKDDAKWQSMLKEKARLLLGEGKFDHRACSRAYLVNGADLWPEGSKHGRSPLPTQGGEGAIRGCSAFKLLPGFTIQESKKCIERGLLLDKGCAVPNVPNIGMCCEYCAQSSGCNAFTYAPGTQDCTFVKVSHSPTVKQSHDWNNWVGLRMEAGEMLSDFVMQRQAERANEDNSLQDGVVVVTAFSR